MNWEKLFERIYLENIFNRIYESEENLSTSTNNWATKMRDLKNLLKTQTEISYIEFSEENIKALGEFIQSPIERVFFDNIGKETLFHKMNRKSGDRGDIDRRLFIDAIPKALMSPAFIIEHIPTENEEYKDIRHLYFKAISLNNKCYKMMFVVSLLDTKRPKLISFYSVDIYDVIHSGDTIVYEGGQQTKVKLSKG